MNDGPIKLTLSPLFIPYTNQKFGEYTLLENQRSMLDLSRKLIVIDSPTGSGKTLGILAKLFQQGTNGILIYPTNELIRDQLNNISKYIKSLGYNVYINKIKHEYSNKDVGLFEIDGPTLEELIENLRIKTKGEGLKKIIQSGFKRKILLMNPDAFYLLSTAKYKHGLDLIKELVKENFRFLAIDEFHLYYGINLANLMLILKMLHKLFDTIVISTATIANNVIDLLKKKVVYSEDSFGKAKYNLLIKEESYVRKIRYKTDIEIRKIPSGRNIMYGDEDIATLIEDVASMIEKYKSSPIKVKVLIIVNSVIFAEQLRVKLENEFAESSLEIGAIHGFVPKDKRKISNITVGTSAIEVGIDFDTASLIFEANNASSFIQRLGRAGRHREAEVISYIPDWDFNVLRRLISEASRVRGEKFDYLRFIELIRKAMIELPNYSNFIMSKHVDYLVLAFAYKVVHYLYKANKISEEKIEDEFKKFLCGFYNDIINNEKYCQQSNLKIKLLLKRIKSKKPKGTDSTIIRALLKSQFRGSFNYIPAVYRGSVTTISLQDLNKIDFEVIDIDSYNPPNEIEKKAYKRIKRLADINGIDYFLKIHEIGKFNNIKIEISRSIKDYIDNHPFIIDDNLIYITTSNPKLSDKIYRLLKGELAYLSTRKEDWRFASFRIKKDLWLILGHDALLAWYTNETRKSF